MTLCLQQPPPLPHPLRTPFTTLRPIPHNLPPSPGLRFHEKLLYLENHLGLDSSLALAANPLLRSHPLPSLLSTSNLLLSHGLRPRDLGRIFSMYPHLLTSPHHLHLLPVLSFLQGPAAIPAPHLRKSLTRCPRLLVSSVPRQLTPTLYFLRRLQVTVSCQTTLLLVSSVEHTLIPKMDFLQSLGLSYSDVKWMVRRSPGLLTFSVENNFVPKVRFLEEMGRGVGELRDFPQYFAFSLEGRIKPRHRMLVEKGLEMPLAEMLKVSDGEFRERLVEMRLKTVITRFKEGHFIFVKSFHQGRNMLDDVLIESQVYSRIRKQSWIM